MELLKKAVNYSLRILILAAIIYVGFQTFAVVHNTYKTETAIAYNMTDSVLLQGVAVFDEIKVSGNGLIGYLTASGNRVSGGTAVAEKYDSIEQAEARAKLIAINEQIAMLEKSTTGSADINLLAEQMQNSVVKALDSFYRGDFADSDIQFSNYLLSANKSQFVTGKLTDVSEQLSVLYDEKNDIEDVLKSAKTLTAETSGYFVGAQHARYLTHDDLEFEEASAQHFKELLSEDDLTVLDDNCAGKIVYGYGWKFYGICSIQDCEKLKVNQTVMISITEDNETTTVEASIDSIEADFDNQIAKVCLSSDYMNSVISKLSKASVSIDLAHFEGIRIPVSALHIVDGNRGVYVKYGNILYFRRIETLYQNEDYILIPFGGSINSSNEVRQYDEVITDGIGLRNEKLV